MNPTLGLLEIKKSKIRNAGDGCFAKTIIPSGTIMGPYHGRYMDRKQRNRVMDATYIWKIHDNLFVDAKRFKKDNPLRYINGSKTSVQKKKINCDVKFIGPDHNNLKVYYMATKNILPGEELIISYGNTYFL
jgi:SET domain-containing protein